MLACPSAQKSAGNCSTPVRPVAAIEQDVAAVQEFVPHGLSDALQPGQVMLHDHHPRAINVAHLT
eukprot:2827926-Prorocentrum_lima.AAC.1